jgi:hypothetical protein
MAMSGIRAVRSGRERHEGGQGLVEFALVMSVFLVLILGVIDLSRAVFAYVALSQGTAAAGRVAIVDQNPSEDCGATPGSWWCTGTSTVSVIGTDVAFAISYLDFDYTTGDSGRSAASPCGEVLLGCVAEVTASYSFSAVTPVISALFPGGITISAVTRLPVERPWCESPVDSGALYPSGPCPAG